MKDIFANLYNKVFGFFQKQDEKEDNEHAKDIARNRLKLVLMQDRTNLTPYLLEKMRGEMIEVLSKYVEMDKDALELNFEQEGDSMALMLSIPVLRAKDDEEIHAAIDEENTNEQQETEDGETEYKKLYEELKEKYDAIIEENKCITCDCEYKETDMECDKCPKLETCECVEECLCDTCDCEYKDSDMECEDCPKSETCDCYAEFKEECSCDETCKCGCQDGEECTCNETDDCEQEKDSENTESLDEQETPSEKKETKKKKK